MTTLTKDNSSTRSQSVREARSSMPFLLQVTMMTWRSIITLVRTPAAVLPSLIISGFFLFIYEATLGNAADGIPGLSTEGYLAFILPLSIVSASLSGAGVAGQNLVRDIENGYFDKLLLTPVSRSALLLGQIIAGAMVLLLQTIIILGVGMLMGLDSATGFAGLLTVAGFAVLLGTGFAGFTVGVALRTGSAAATQGANFIFFPLTFLTATFVPVELLGGWLKTAARLNPITYILDAMRSVLLTGWDGEKLLAGLLACAVLGGVPFFFALTSLRARTRRK